MSHGSYCQPHRPALRDLRLLMGSQPSAMEAVQAHGGESPLFAVVVRSVPLGHAGSTGWMTGSALDLIPLLVLGARKAFRFCFRRGREPNQVLAVYVDRIELLTWPAESLPPGDVTLVCRRSDDRRIFVGDTMLRMASREWLIGPARRQELLQVLRDSAWRSHVAVMSA